MPMLTLTPAGWRFKLPLATQQWPDATNTGVPAGVSLTQVPAQLTSGTGWRWRADLGAVSVEADNVSLDALDIAGGIYVPLNNTTYVPIYKVTVTRCKIRGTGYTDGSFMAYLGPGSTMTDCELGGMANGTTWSGSQGILAQGSAGAPVTIARINVHHTEHGIVDGGYVTCSDSWFHTLVQGDAPYAADHTECVFLDDGHFSTYRHNSFSSGNTATFFVQNYGNTPGGTGDLTIDGNLFTYDGRNADSGAWAIRVENKAIKNSSGVGGTTGAATIHITNNQVTGAWPLPWSTNPVIYVPAGSTVAGNIDGSGMNIDALTAYEPVVY